MTVVRSLLVQGPRALGFVAMLGGTALAMVPSGNGTTAVRPGPPMRFHATVVGGTPTILVRGELPKEAIRRVFYVHINEIKHCYQQELQRRPGLNGRLVVNFTIDSQGQVHDMSVPVSTMGLPSLSLCVSEAVQRWEFPTQQSLNLGAEGEAQTVVNYPFVLKPRPVELPAVGVQVSDEELAALGVIKDPAPPPVDILF